MSERKSLPMNTQVPGSQVPGGRAQRTGQVMLLTVLTLGGTILGATTIAGLLMLYQIRASSDLANSGKALYGADTGIEWGLYQFFKPGSTAPAPVFTNGTTFTTVCFEVSDCSGAGAVAVNCRTTTATNTIIRAIGTAVRSTRALDSCLTS